MAGETSHAAQRDETFSVEVERADGPATVLAAGVKDFLDAVDFAMEWIERADPTRTEPPSVAIFATDGGRHEQVWGYPTPSGKLAATGETRRSLEIFGFDPVAWRPAVNSGGRTPPRPTSGPRPECPPLAAFAAAAVDPDSDAFHVTQEPLRLRARSASEGLREEARAMWVDRVSRCCLLLGLVSLWLTLTLLEPAFLVLFAASAASLWSRRGHCPAPANTGLDEPF